MQFWKDSSNLRDDKYGGSDENKGRCERSSRQYK
jgi:2,4-dienoyl-CoA reductase-like NADH-dependent reductase (Old Yellow Enzyme family)